MDFCNMSAREIAAGVREKKFKASEVFEDCLKKIQEPDFIKITLDAGRAQAKQIDELNKVSKVNKILAGVPVILKDNICTHGIQTTAGSRVLKGWSPPYDATAWNLLATEGAVLLGKGGMGEFDTEISDGSLDGGAAAVSAGYVPFSLGSDCGGSIRLPAMRRRIYGFKPTYGLVSRHGLIACGSSLDQIGPFTRNLDDMALIMQILACYDPKDSTSARADISEINFTQRTHSLKNRRIVIIKEFMERNLNKEIKENMQQAINFLEKSGAEIIEISLPVSLPITTRCVVACYYAIAMSEAHSNFARFDGVRYGLTADATGSRNLFETVRSEGFGSEVKNRIIAGTYMAEPEPFRERYVTAMRVRTLIIAEFNKIFTGEGAGKIAGKISEKIDCILQPISDATNDANNCATNCATSGASDEYNTPANVAGLPSLAMPSGFQLVGPRWSDGDLLDIGFELEKGLALGKGFESDKKLGSGKSR